MSERELKQIETKIKSRLQELEPDVELVALEQAAAERLRLVIDRAEGVDLSLCERVTKHFPDLLEEWSLEVASPGPERPLTKPEHFRRFIGRRIRVKTSEDVHGHRSFTGRLADADDENISVDSGSGPQNIPLAAIRRSNLLPDTTEVAA